MWAFEIFAKISDRSFAVVRLLIKMDDPGLLIQDVEPTVQGRVGFEVPEATRELETTGFEFGT